METLNQLRIRWMKDNCILFAGFHSLILNWVINPENPEHEILRLKDSVGSYVVNTGTTTLTAVANHYHCTFKKLETMWAIAKELLNWKAIVISIEQKNLTAWLKDSLDWTIDDILPSINTAWTGHAVCVRREWLTFIVYDSLGGRKYKVPNLFKHILSKQLRGFAYLLS